MVMKNSTALFLTELGCILRTTLHTGSQVPITNKSALAPEMKHMLYGSCQLAPEKVCKVWNSLLIHSSNRDNGSTVRLLE